MIPFRMAAWNCRCLPLLRPNHDFPLLRLALLVAALNFCDPLAAAAQSVDETIVVVDENVVLEDATGKDIGHVTRGRQLRVEKLRQTTTEWLGVEVNGKFGWINKKAARSLDDGITDFTKAINEDPNADDYTARARIWHAKGELDIALADYDKAVRLKPRWAQAYLLRGLLYADKQDLDKAVANFNEALRLRPKYAAAYNHRGWALKMKGDYVGALASYDAAVKCDPRGSWSYAARAWILATCPQDSIRDGTKAIADATKACELNQWKHSGDLSALAAAYAESGQFDKALEWQKKAIESVPAGQQTALEAHLKLYESGKPMREDAPKAKGTR